jgi:hypothetical protein
MSIDFTSREGQDVVFWEEVLGNLRPAAAHRLLFPEDKATLENMELREICDNAHLLQGPYVPRREA